MTMRKSSRKHSNWCNHSFIAGISENAVQNCINANRQYCAKHPIFQKKDCLKPVVAESHGYLSNWCSGNGEKLFKYKSNKICQYIPNIFDVFSRFVLLMLLQLKEPTEIVSHLQTSFLQVGLPNVIHYNGGNEFKSNLSFLAVFV